MNKYIKVNFPPSNVCVTNYYDVAQLNIIFGHLPPGETTMWDEAEPETIS